MNVNQMARPSAKGAKNKSTLYRNVLLLPPLLLCGITLSYATTSPVFGSRSGSAFTDINNSNQTLTSIKINSGWWIDKIQGITATGALPVHGGTGGDPYTVTWPSNEYLVRVYGKYGWTFGDTWIDSFFPSYIGQITFVTNTGRVLGPYGLGLGLGQGNSFDYTVPNGNRITGFNGRSSDFVNALGVNYNTLPVAPTTVPSDALAYWTFDNATGTSVPDASGKGKTLTLGAGTTITATGKLGSALLNNGANSIYGGSTAGPVVNTAGSFSVSGWMRFDQLPACWNQSLASQDGNTVSGWYLGITPPCGGQPAKFGFKMHSSDADASQQYLAQSTTSPQIGQWYHLTGVRDAVANTMSLYVNGTLIQTINNPSKWTANGAFTIGRAKFSGQLRDPAYAAIDAVSAYGRALTATEVSTLYTAGGNLTPTTVTLPAGTTQCATENGTCNLPLGSTASVYYGSNGKYFVKTAVNGSIDCNNATFGDPISGTGKSCSYVITTVGNPIQCATENGTCNLPAGTTASVYYGVNGKYFVKNNVTGSIACNNATFGDPTWGSGKSCYYVITTEAPSTPPTTAPDLAISVAQPAPALKATAMSEVQLTVTNNGTSTASAPIMVMFTLPANVSAPQKFTRAADHWLCKTVGQAVSCSYDLPIANGLNSILRIPVTPAANTLNTTPAPFVASVAADTGETNQANNGPVNMTPATPVTALTLNSIADPLGIYSLPLLDPTTITKYALPMPNLLASAYKHTPNTTAVAGSDSYTLDIKKVKAQVLPPGFPATDVFAYGDPSRPDTFSYPAHTIEARSTNAALNAAGLGRPSKIQYQNTTTATEHVLDIVDPTLGTFSIVDRSLVGANTISTTNLREEIRTVAHLHGAKIIDQQSNGHPEAWSSPAGQRGVAASSNPSVPFNASPFNYSNNQEASMLWYRDNTLGMSRLNVYAGLAGLYMVRDDNEKAMITNNQLPSGAYEVPLVLQDRMFRADGSFAYPDIDVVAPSPSWVKEFYGDVMVVNGVAWPYFQVEPRKYRFRVLNASNMRVYKLSLENSANTTSPVAFQVIGTDGGFLNAPVSTSSLTIAPGERYDIVVDFAALNGANITLKNAAGAPFSGATLVGGEAPPVVGLHDQLMQFRVNIPLSNTPVSTLPATLRTPITSLTPTVTTPRKLSMHEVINSFSRVKPLLGITAQGPKLWTDPLTETATNGSVETWEIYNNTPNTHAIHVHAGQFQIVERQAFNATLGINGELINITFPSGAIAASALEKGWKDTVIAYPSLDNNPGTVDGQTVNGMVTRIRMKFESLGQFLWHCQMLEHQDHEMQRPMTVL